MINNSRINVHVIRCKYCKTVYLENDASIRYHGKKKCIKIMPIKKRKYRRKLGRKR